MKKSYFFKMLCTGITWVYCAATVQAGQIVTQKDRDWAKQAVRMAEKEKKLSSISARNTVGVLYFNNTSGRSELNPLQKGLAIMLITDLMKIDSIQVVERVKLQALLDEMYFGSSGIVDAKTAPRVGQLLGAYYLSSGDIAGGAASDLSITPVLIDVPLEKVAQQKITAGTVEDIFRMEKEILFGIVQQLNISLSSRERAELNKPLTASAAAAFAFFLGIDLSDKGSYAEAAKMFEKALLEDKYFTLAKDSLQEMKSLGLTDSASATTQSTTPAKPVAEAEGGSSFGAVALTVLGLAVVGGGVAFALSSSGDDDTPAAPAAEGPSITSSNPANGGRLEDCQGGTLYFYFNKAIQNCADVTISGGWSRSGNPPQSIVNSTELHVGYAASRTTGSVCYDKDSDTMTVVVSGCQDREGRTMQNATFSFTDGGM